MMIPVASLVRNARMTPLAAALALALAAGTTFGSAPTTAHATPHSDTTTQASPRYALRQQARARAIARGASSTRAASPPPRLGATLPVTSCLDDSDPGTLRNVLASAAEGDTVDLGALTCSTITLTQGALDLGVLGPHHVNNLTLLGPGRDEIAIDANGGRAILHGDYQTGLGTLVIKNLTIRNGNYTHGLASCIDSSGNVELENVTVTDCHASNGGPITFGGAVSVSGKLTMRTSTISDSSSTAAGNNVAFGGGAYVMGDAELIDSTISGNRVQAAVGSAEDGYYLTVGGGLYVRGNLVVTRSTISGNTVEATTVVDGALGGGVFVRGVARIDSSTIDGNRAKGQGGGVYKAVFSIWGDPPPPQDTHLDIVNSTIHGNGAGLSGAGIFALRPTTISNSTIALNHNSTGIGAGILFADAGLPLTIQSSIVAANSSCDDCSPPLWTDIASADMQLPLSVSGANNLIQVVTPNITLPVDTIAANPQFAPLADNGGPTRTLALDPDSPAIDAGNNASALDFDQRGEGYARVVGTAADIGAFEVQAAVDDTIFKDGFDDMPPG